MSDPNVGHYQALQHMPDADFALSRLKKIVSAVRPIMRKHNLYVHVLSEFYPEQANLLGCNTGQGQLIEVRLRCTARTTEYLSFEAVVDTFLHELAHIHHSNHGPGFQQLWELYRRERYSLLQGESISSAFSGPGQRLGGLPAFVAGYPANGLFGGAPGGVWSHDMSALAANAAQRRLMFAGSGQRLGGSSAPPPSITLQDGTRLVAGCLDRPALGIFGNNALPNAIPAAALNQPPLRPTRPPQVINLDSDSDSDVEVLGGCTYSDAFENKCTWSCPTCTFDNPDIFLCCEACTSERPSSTSRLSNRPVAVSVNHESQTRRHHKTKVKKSAAEMVIELDKKIAAKPLGWTCGSCGTFMESKWWTCSVCGTMKEA